MKDLLLATYQRLLSTVHYSKHRSLFQKISLQNRMIGLVGPRGVGKTTLLLQLIKKKLDKKKTFYFSADHIYFNQNTLYEFVHDLHIHQAMDVIVIDEIHKYANWNQELKNLYDSFPELKIIFSGSSSIDLIKGAYDLSRRVVLYHLPGLSLREYIEFAHDKIFPPISFSDLIENTQDINQDIVQFRGLQKIFQNYLQQGYYPFLQEDEFTYFEKIMGVVNKTIFEDIANFYQLKTENLQYFLKLLSFAATIPPGELNTHNISKSIGIDHKTAAHYCEILREVGLLNIVGINEAGHSLLRKSSKLLLNNTNLLTSLCSHLQKNMELGLLRETFFVQTLQNSGLVVTYSKVGDYEVKDILFEIGGKNKSFKQIKQQKNARLVKDNSLHADAMQIPLYLFGFLY